MNNTYKLYNFNHII